MGAPRHVPPEVASGVESEEPRPALWGFIFSSECDDFPVLGFLEKKVYKEPYICCDKCASLFSN